MRQTVRSNGAAVVAIGAQKPTSSYTLERIEGEIATVAHLSERIPRQYLGDYAGLQQFLGTEMGYGIQRATDRIIINGSGTAPESSGILNTTGVLAQPYATDVFGSCRSAMTRLAEAGETATAFVFTPTDWQAVETLRDANERFQLGAAPSTTPARTLWSVPVVLSTELPAGTALVGDFRTVTLFVREAIRLDWSEAGPELFDKNAVKFRAENRVGLALTRPGALCTVDITAA